jgi:hypothetical protein
MLETLRAKGLQIRRSHQVKGWIAFSTDFDLIYMTILLFTTSALANGAGSVLAEAIRQRVARRRTRRKRIVLLEVGARDERGRETWFRGTGEAQDVLSQFDAWNTMWAPDDSKGSSTLPRKTVKRHRKPRSKG